MAGLGHLNGGAGSPLQATGLCLGEVAAVGMRRRCRGTHGGQSWQQTSRCRGSPAAAYACHAPANGTTIRTTIRVKPSQQPPSEVKAPFWLRPTGKGALYVTNRKRGKQHSAVAGVIYAYGGGLAWEQATPPLLYCLPFFSCEICNSRCDRNLRLQREMVLRAISRPG